MSGQCFSCGENYGFFKKEHGCKQCGYSFCSDCLQYKAPVPKEGNKKLKVCRKCHDLLTGKVKAAPHRVEPPDAFAKRAAALDSSHQQPSTTHTTARPKGTERDIQQRLHALKEDRKPVQNQTEIERRLAKLKGHDPDQRPQHSSLPNPKKKFAQEEVDDLLAEMCDEVELDEKFDPVKQTEARLRELKGEANPDTAPPRTAGLTGTVGATSTTISTDARALSAADAADLQRLLAAAEAESRDEAERAVQLLGQDAVLQQRLKELKKKNKERQEKKKEVAEKEDSSEEDEEAATRRIIKQLTAEAALEEETDKFTVGAGRSAGAGNGAEVAREDEFPWCCICNNDATLRCPGCDHDLYCKRCFKEGHETFCMEEHKPLPYKAPKDS